MALESILTRIKTELGLLLSAWSLSDSQKTDLILGALNYDLSAASGIKYSGEIFDLNFRKEDSDKFRIKTNATLNDVLTITDTGEGSAVVETNAISMLGLRPMLMHLTYDGDLGAGSFSYDLCLNAIKESLTAGVFLSEHDSPPTMNWGTDLYTEGYPADHLVVRLTLATAGSIRAVRIRLMYVGSVVPQQVVGQVANLAAMRFHVGRLEEAAQARWSLEAKEAVQNQINFYYGRARGILADPKKIPSGSSGGVIETGVVNPHRRKVFG